MGRRSLLYLATRGYASNRLTIAVQYWVNFASTRNPGTISRVTWPQYKQQQDLDIVLDLQLSIQQGQGSPKSCDFWASNYGSHKQCPQELGQVLTKQRALCGASVELIKFQTVTSLLLRFLHKKKGLGAVWAIFLLETMARRKRHAKSDPDNEPKPKTVRVMSGSLLVTMDLSPSFFDLIPIEAAAPFSLGSHLPKYAA